MSTADAGTAGAPAAGGDSATGGSPGVRTDAARQRLAHAQAGLLAALVAGAPPPEGFDHDRLDVQRRALTAKRGDVVAKVAPELPAILGEKTYRTAFSAYARNRPMTGGYRRDALAFAAYALDERCAAGRKAHRRLRTWWLERSAPEPPPEGRVRRTLFLARELLRRG